MKIYDGLYRGNDIEHKKKLFKSKKIEILKGIEDNEWYKVQKLAHDLNLLGMEIIFLNKHHNQ